MGNIKTSLIIPCYFANQKLVDMTQDCLDSLQWGLPDEVIVVDDVNGDGFASTVNKGLKQATGDILIVSNNDILFKENWLEALLSPLNSGNDISTVQTSDQPLNRDLEANKSYPLGALWAMNRYVYDTIGGMDTTFGRGYFEDTDYRKRAEWAGFKIGRAKDFVVEHRAKATFKVVDPDDKHFLEAAEKYQERYGVLD